MGESRRQRGSGWHHATTATTTASAAASQTHLKYALSLRPPRPTAPPILSLLLDPPVYLSLDFFLFLSRARSIP